MSPTLNWYALCKSYVLERYILIRFQTWVTLTSGLNKAEVIISTHFSFQLMEIWSIEGRFYAEIIKTWTKFTNTGIRWQHTNDTSWGTDLVLPSRYDGVSSRLNSEWLRGSSKRNVWDWDSGGSVCAPVQEGRKGRAWEGGCMRDNSATWGTP